MLLSIPNDQVIPYRRTLASRYEKKIRVALLDKNGDTLENLTPAFQGGQISVEAKRDVTHGLNISILDPRHAYGFDADTYQGGLLDLTRMIRVFWVVDGPLLARPISQAVFTGPVTDLSRTGALVDIEAQGKEVRGLTPSRRTLIIKKGEPRTDAIKRILRERMGETRLGGIPDLPAKLPADVIIGPKDQPWKVAKRIAASFNRQLFYDGGGVPRLRKKPTKAAWEFRTGQGGSVTTPVVTRADLKSIRNHVRVTGATPKGKKQPISAQATADRWHPMSPWELGVEDAPMWLIDEFSNDHLRTEKECREVAEERLRDGLRLLHEASFNSIPVPHLNPLDLIDVHTEYESVTTRLQTFTLPLYGGSDMTLGHIDPYSLHKRRNGYQNHQGAA
jgi:hypothetical protein